MRISKTYLVLLLGMILWGLFPIVTHRFVFSLDPVLLVSISTLTASIPFFILLFAKKEMNQFFSLKYLKTMLGVAFFTAAGQGLLFIGTKITSGTNTGLLLQVEPIYSLILGTIFLGEILKRGQIGATLAMVIGAVTIVYKGGVNINLGDILILLSPLMFQISHLIGKKLLNNKIDVNLILASRQFYGGIMLLLFTFLTNGSAISLFNVNIITTGLCLGMFTAVVALCWYSSIKKVPVSVASSFIPITALVSLAASAIFLKEVISPQQFIGFFFIVGGMLWQTSSTK
ncbi:MAG: DMT family transporter [Candidatus Roizmanbacteria bacterium]|nr:DMT family transporter [Candidatus Roizmanbacteria bacterium]MCR4312738.1 DMT family transporter [Candidatus Roizmanbacteria bacterium]